MTTFSNKILYTKGQLDYRCIILTGNETETTFNFKDPLFNVISIEAVQGEITTNDTTEWVEVRCPEIDKRIENGITSYDTSLLVTKSAIPFIKSHTSRYFAKPKDRLDAVTVYILRKLPSTGTTTLSGDWIIELEIATVRVPTHADWRNIPDTEVSNDTSEILEVQVPALPITPPEPLVEKKRKKKKKENMEIQPASTGSSLEGSLLSGSLGLLGLGSALALGVRIK